MEAFSCSFHHITNFGYTFAKLTCHNISFSENNFYIVHFFETTYGFSLPKHFSLRMKYSTFALCFHGISKKVLDLNTEGWLS